MEAKDAEDPQGISFNIALEQQSYRLVELPSSVLDILTSEAPPVLQLKSSTIANDSNEFTPSAYLCSQDRTFEVRQVHSSNILYVLQASDSRSNLLDTTVASAGVTAISQCKALLELVPGTSSAVEHIIKKLPLYKATHSLKDTRSGPSKSEFLADSPFSESELEIAARELCVFETETSLLIPDATVLCGLWQSILSAITIKGTDISKSFDIEEIRTLVQEDGYNLPLLRAGCSRIQSQADYRVPDQVKIDRSECVMWVGSKILESYGPGGVLSSDLLKRWRDNLPEVWRDDATIEKLEGTVQDLGNNNVASTNRLLEKQGPPKADIKTASARPMSKWHEKFKASRK